MVFLRLFLKSKTLPADKFEGCYYKQIHSQKYILGYTFAHFFKSFFISRITMMEAHFAKIIEAVGEDLTREGLIDTPKRAAKAFKFLNNGYEKTLEEVLNGAIFTADSEDMVIVKDIELYSLCEHHLLPFIGKCHVGYLPQGKVLGLSKIARVVDMFARRLQIQEKLTSQIADAIEKATGARGVAVVIEAKHLCMMMRGVEKQNSVMTTSAMKGIFRKDISTRSEFLNLINR
jgi:GTP cyclohydrolase I